MPRARSISIAEFRPPKPPPASPRSGRTGPLLLAALVALGAHACSREPPSECPVYRQVTHQTPERPAEVVAEVNGKPILAAELRHRMRARGLSRKAALAALIDEELLVQAAISRGLHRDPGVRLAGKRRAVYRLLREVFERSFTRRDVPESRLRDAYRAASRTRYHRPEIRRFAHLYVDRPWHRRGRHFQLDKAADDALRKAMESLRARIVAAAPRRWRDFTAFAKSPEGRRLGLQAQTGTASRQELRPAFSRVLFSMKHRSEISPVIQTKPWYHIAYLVQIIPARDVPYAEARAELLERIWPAARRKAFGAWIAKLKARCPIRLHFENLPVTPLHREAAP